MAFIRKRGRTKFMYFPVTVSTALSKDSLVVMNTAAGTLIAATSTTKGMETIGVLRHAIASTDDDYAVARSVEVEVPVEKWVEWEADVTSGLAATDVCKYLDLTDSTHCNYTGTTYDICFVTKYLSTTKALVVLNIGPEALGVQVG